MVEGGRWKSEDKEFATSLGTLGLEGKTLIVDSLENTNLQLSARNVRRAKVVNSFGLNIYDLLYHDHLVLSRGAASSSKNCLAHAKRTANRWRQRRQKRWSLRRSPNGLASQNRRRAKK